MSARILSFDVRNASPDAETLRQRIRHLVKVGVSPRKLAKIIGVRQAELLRWLNAETPVAAVVMHRLRAYLADVEKFLDRPVRADVERHPS